MNKEFKGTKGEWRVFNIENNKQFHTYFKISNSEHELDPRLGTSVCNITTRDSEQAIANAQLISAAPDLLEALMNIENDNFNIPESIWQMRNKAINKALGND